MNANLTRPRPVEIPLERIEPSPANVREELRGLPELAASMRSLGVLQPILVTPSPRRGLVTIIDGHRRRAAAAMAGLSTMPALATKAGSPTDTVITMLIAGLHDPLRPTEEAQAMERLRLSGMSVAEIARATCRPRSTVSERLLLARLPKEAQDMIDADALAVRDAVEIARDIRDGQAGTATLRVTRSTWLGPHHRLAPKVRATCEPEHRQTRQFIGGVGCGQCWEQAIRDDEPMRASA
jgi:ParB family chromosome partitioning protein